MQLQLSIPLLADYFGILGLPVSLFGLTWTIWEARKAKSAATLAKEAADDTKAELVKVGTVIDLASLISSLEDLKVLHRAMRWPEALDRYSRIRGQLVRIGALELGLSKQALSLLQNAIVELSLFEARVEAARIADENIAYEDLNFALGKILDGLNLVFGELRSGGYGR